MDSQTYKIWSGFAFENVCLRHLRQIKKALGISGIYTEASSFYKKGKETEEGVQIDLVLDRKDRVVNLFEIKFYNDALYFTEADLAGLRAKQRIFLNATNTRKYISWVLITTFGLKNKGVLDMVLSLDDLFAE